MKKEVLCETIERTVSQPVMFDTKEQAREEMVKRFKEAMGMTDEEFEAMDDDSSECFCGENEAYCVNTNHDNCDWSIFTIEDTEYDPNKILTTGAIFTATDEFGRKYTYKFIGVKVNYDGYICLKNLDSNTTTIVEPMWFRVRDIKVIS